MHAIVGDRSTREAGPDFFAVPYPDVGGVATGFIPIEIVAGKAHLYKANNSGVAALRVWAYL